MSLQTLGYQLPSHYHYLFQFSTMSMIACNFQKNKQKAWSVSIWPRCFFFAGRRVVTSLIAAGSVTCVLTSASSATVGLNSQGDRETALDTWHQGCLKGEEPPAARWCRGYAAHGPCDEGFLPSWYIICISFFSFADNFFDEVLLRFAGVSNKTVT